MRFSGIFQTISFTVRKRFVNAFLPSPYTVSKPSKNAPKTAKKIRNACGKNPHPLPPSCGSQSPKNRFVRPFFGILQVLALKTPARWPFSHSLCVFTFLPFTQQGISFSLYPLLCILSIPYELLFHRAQKYPLCKYIFPKGT